jgi:hypothetical protein
MKSFRHALAALAALALLALPNMADAQTANGKVTTAAPTYTNNTAAPLSIDLSGGLRVNCVTGCSAGTGAVNINQVGGNAVTTTLPVSGTVTLGAGAAAIGSVSVSTLPSIPAGANAIGSVTLGAGAAAIGSVSVSTLPSIPAGANAIGSVSVTSLPAIPAGTNAIGTVTALPPVASGTTNHSAILGASTNSTNVKNGAGTLFEISVYNSGSTIAWLKFYNSASAPTCGTGTPEGRYMIPAAASGGAGSNVTLSLGKAFTTGISYCVTTGVADNDTGATAATTYTVNLTYR